MTTLKKPSQAEEDFIARQEAEKLRKRALEKARAIGQGEREQLKKEHYMHCPKCGMELTTVKLRGVSVDRCFGCNGMWLDDGEIEAIAGTEPDLVQRLLRVFKGA